MQCRKLKNDHGGNLANLISKLNFYKLIPYPMDNCFTSRRDRSRQMPEKDVLYIIPAGPASSVHSLGGASILASCPDRVTSVHLFHCLNRFRPLVSW